MRGLLLGAVLWLGLGGVAAAASAPTVVIQADQGQPAHMATYRGPGGTPIPVGACGAVIHGRVWVLPCHDPQVVAYRRAAARAARARQEMEAGGFVLAAALGGAAAALIRRRSTPAQGV